MNILSCYTFLRNLFLGSTAWETDCLRRVVRGRTRLLLLALGRSTRQKGRWVCRSVGAAKPRPVPLRDDGDGTAARVVWWQ